MKREPRKILALRGEHCRLPVLAAVGLSVWLGCAGLLSAQSIAVPNGSFESPTPPPGFPAWPQLDVWQKSSQPPGVVLPGTITWEQLSGVFPNTPGGESDHIDNMIGNQAGYLFSIPGVSIFQELGQSFEAGNSYQLTLGLLGGGGLPDGSRFMMNLYYLDGANTRVSLGAQSVEFSAAAFPTPAHFYDYSLTIPSVQAGDAWVGARIGIELGATLGTGARYWDVDDVRLAVVPEPRLFAVAGVFAFGVVLLRSRSRRAS
jgi:hypothetical protein